MIRVERQLWFGKREQVKVLDHSQSGIFSLGNHYLELTLFRDDLLHIDLLDKGPLMLRYSVRRRQEELNAGYAWTNTSAQVVEIGPGRLWPWTERLIVTNNPGFKF